MEAPTDKGSDLMYVVLVCTSSYSNCKKIYIYQRMYTNKKGVNGCKQ